MAVFNLFRRLASQDATDGERRADDRLRTTLGARVLVVDDSATIRAVLGKMLMQDGYEVLKAADGESAIEMARSQLPDLIFLDIVLPGISGFAVLRSLRRESCMRATPIVMMSGNQQATEQFYVQRFGADGFVKKPFGRAEVFHAIRSLVQAGRMPGRIEATPVSAIPEGMTAEEWNAIPDVAMPDEAHLARQPAAIAASNDAASRSPSVADARSHAAVPVAPKTTPVGQHGVAGSWSGPTVSMAVRPTLGSAAQSAAISVSSAVVQRRAPAAGEAEELERRSDEDKT